ncbi:uncharacterized protein LOC110066539 isoform X1 [Orbicella faveolata]|uniref:uncharacterized protein LOC110066539 isoform X1 n=1 Tax=Orbicella faveolata TaxID=48498 RepID=UPI0009E3F3D6|nr:uncharacterized protein LOC110066539 isoform X1 [Orbicella faveolata]
MDEILSKEDLKRFEEQYNAELEKGKVSSDTQFNYAWCLIRSDNKGDILKGVLLLQGIQVSYQIHKQTAANRTSKPSRNRTAREDYYKNEERWLNWTWYSGWYSSHCGWSSSLGWTCICQSQVNIMLKEDNG